LLIIAAGEQQVPFGKVRSRLRSGSELDLFVESRTASGATVEERRFSAA
jgi:hypothetical protein